MKPSHWDDDDYAVFKRVVRRMREIRHEIEYHWVNERLYLPTKAHDLVFDHMQAAIHRVWRTSDRTLGLGLLKDWAVIEAANRGDLEPLIFRLRESESLPAPIRRVIIEFLSGRRNLKTGRLPDEEQRGSPRKSVDERRRPKHDAADLVPIIVEILRSECDKQKGSRELAIEYAARIKRVRPGTVTNYFKLKPSDSRRIDRRP
jgi:hypothetical protein